MIVVVYCIKLYRAMILKREKLVANPALHSFNSSTIELIFVTWEVNGAEIDASAIDNDKPMSACFKAPQSLAPSPHMDTFLPIFWNKEIALILSFGLALANTVVLLSILISSGVNYLIYLSNILLRAGPVIHN